MKKTFKISGMHCSSCSRLIEVELEDKVNKININISNGETIIDFNPKKINEDKIAEIIENLGYRLN